MTELSYLWDGTVTGDASIAPYNKEEFNFYMFRPSITENLENSVYVVPGYLQDLWVKGTTAGSYVTIAPGAAIVGGNYLYVSDATVTLTVDQIETTDYFRYDYVILRVDVEAQTVRLAIKKGAETNDPAALVPPTLTQDDFVREIAIAQIYREDNSIVWDDFVYDLREFATNYYNAIHHKRVNRNLAVNSEFMATSAMIVASGTYEIPDAWSLSGAAATLSSPLTGMSRGQSIAVVGDGGERYLYQIIPIDPAIKTFTVKGIIKNTTGGSTFQCSVGLYPTMIDGSAVSGVHKRQVYTSQVAGTETEFQFTVTFDENSLFEAVTLRVGTIFPTTGTVEVGQILVVQGYHPGPLREIHETIMFHERLDGTNWTATAKSSGTTLIDLITEFGILDRTRGVFVRVRARDSGSAGGSPSLAVEGYAAPYNVVYGTVELNGVTNDVYRESTFYVPVDIPVYDVYDYTPQLRAVVVASGAGTLDATLEIVGITT